MEKLDLDAFIGIMDDMLTKSHIFMTFESKEGTQEVELKDNIGMGPVAQFFVMMQGMATAFKEFEGMIDAEKKEQCVDAILGMLKGAIMEVEDGKI